MDSPQCLSITVMEFPVICTPNIPLIRMYLYYDMIPCTAVFCFLNNEKSCAPTHIGIKILSIEEYQLIPFLFHMERLSNQTIKEWATWERRITFLSIAKSSSLLAQTILVSFSFSTSDKKKILLRHPRNSIPIKQTSQGKWWCYV